jgi:catechol-2,3-dioxygenase
MSGTPPYIHHFSITAPRAVLNDMIAFYSHVLDLQPGPRPDFGIAGHWLYAGDHPILHLIEDPGRDDGKTGYFDHIALRCDDVDTVRARLSERGMKYSEMTTDAVKQLQIFVTDPSGTSVELNFSLA